VVVGLQANFRFMDRAGMATGTRKVAQQLWKDGIPRGDRMQLVKDLYAVENKHLAAPSGSQDMIGLIYPGVNRLDYDADFEGGYFPRHIESNNDPQVARWLEQVVHVLPVAPRPPDYDPLVVKNLDQAWVQRLGRTGQDCYHAIVHKDLAGLGNSMNECMACWAHLLPGTMRHATINMDLAALLEYYQQRYAGAMYSGCGGGYLYVISEAPVPGSFGVQIRYE